MKHAIEKRFSRPILAASIAAIGLSAPLAAQAEDEDLLSLIRPSSEAELGVAHVSDGSYKFGDYGRGMQRRGEHLIGNVRMNTRGDNNANYLELVARNLGLDSRNISIKGGEQGNYGLSFEYDELYKLHSDSFMTPFTGMGSAVLTKPAVWTLTPVTGAFTGTSVPTTQNMTNLAANMKRFNVETKRKAAVLGLTKQIVGGWDVAVNYKREEKDGTKLTGIPIQIGGGGSRGTALAPEPINYSTDLFDVAARYADEKLQMQLAYHASLFDNSNRSLTFDNLYLNPVASTVGNTALTGRLGQMPSNEFHQVSASGGYALSKETRLTGNASFGRSTQNDAFLPYQTTVVAGQPALPAGSLNGKVETTHLDFKVNTKLSHDYALTAGYKYDDRHNLTPVNEYLYQTADNTLASNYVTAATQGNRRRNTPLSKTQELAYLDIDYHLAKATKLKLGYDYDKIKHTYEPTSGDIEHTVKAEVKHSFSDTASGGLAYAHSERNASFYNGAGPLQATYSATYMASLCVAPNTFLYNGAVTNCTGTASATAQATTPFLDTPALQKFFMSERRRDKLRAFVNMSPSEKLDLQLGASYYHEKYPEAEKGFGLAKATGWTTNFDANLAATDTVSGVFFASYEDYESDVNGHNGASAAAAGGLPVITTLDRQNNTAAFDPLTATTIRTDRSLTMGLGLRVKPGGSYEWGADYTHASTTGSTRFDKVGSRLTLLPVPDAVSRLDRIELFGKYKVQKDITLNVKYAYEQYSSSDWAWDGQTFTSSTSFIGSGQVSPDYVVHVIGASLTYSFK